MTATPQQEGINFKALAGTIVVHALLFLLFLLWKYKLPAPMPQAQEMGMEVNLGTSDNGSGTDQPMATEDPAAFQSSVSYSAPASASNTTTDMMQSTDADAPVINKATENTTAKPAATTADKKNTPTQQQAGNTAKQQKALYVYPGATGKGGNGAPQDKAGHNEGNTTGPGDRGVPHGTPGAGNYVGSPGNGNGGIGHTLVGRRISPDKFTAEFNEGGRVVIAVAVDKDGNIVSKRIKSASNQQLGRLAMQKLAQAKFTRSDNSEPQQFGDVTITFKSH